MYEYVVRENVIGHTRSRGVNDQAEARGASVSVKRGERLIRTFARLTERCGVTTLNHGAAQVYCKRILQSLVRVIGAIVLVGDW